MAAYSVDSTVRRGGLTSITIDGILYGVSAVLPRVKRAVSDSQDELCVERFFGHVASALEEIASELTRSVRLRKASDRSKVSTTRRDRLPGRCNIVSLSKDVYIYTQRANNGRRNENRSGGNDGRSHVCAHTRNLIYLFFDERIYLL